jgi:hypothetical protein
MPVAQTLEAGARLHPARFMSERWPVYGLVGLSILGWPLMLALRKLETFGQWPPLTAETWWYLGVWIGVYALTSLLVARWALGRATALPRQPPRLNANRIAVVASVLALIGSVLIVYEFVVNRGYPMFGSVADLRIDEVNRAARGQSGSLLGGIGRSLASALITGWAVAAYDWRRLQLSGKVWLFAASIAVFLYQARFEGGRFYFFILIISIFLSYLFGLVAAYREPGRGFPLAALRRERPTFIIGVLAAFGLLQVYSGYVFINRVQDRNASLGEVSKEFLESVGGKVTPQEEPKAEEPKAEEPKAEEPKPEEPKAADAGPVAPAPAEPPPVEPQKAEASPGPAPAAGDQAAAPGTPPEIATAPQIAPAAPPENAAAPAAPQMAANAPIPDPPKADASAPPAPKPADPAPAEAPPPAAAPQQDATLVPPADMSPTMYKLAMTWIYVTHGPNEFQRTMQHRALEHGWGTYQFYQVGLFLAKVTGNSSLHFDPFKRLPSVGTYQTMAGAAYIDFGWWGGIAFGALFGALLSYAAVAAVFGFPAWAALMAGILAATAAFAPIMSLVTNTWVALAWVVVLLAMDRLLGPGRASPQ